MFEYLKASNTSKDGIEYIGADVNPFRIDENGLGHGKYIVLVNNYVKNTYEIEEHKHTPGSAYVCTLEKGKEETKTVKEFIKWLLDNNYSDEDFIKAYKKHYPETYEKYYKCQIDKAETEAKLVSIWNEEFPEDEISSINEVKVNK